MPCTLSMRSFFFNFVDINPDTPIWIVCPRDCVGSWNYATELSNVKMSGSGRLENLSCTRDMTRDGCNVCPSTTDFLSAS